MGKTFGNTGKMIIQGVSRVTRPQAPAPTGTAHSEPLPPITPVARSSSVLYTSPAENGSIYFLPYRYYIPSSEMVFSNKFGWDHSERYHEFVRVMRKRMLADYPEKETAVIAEIFSEDMALMFWEKAVQEISVSENLSFWGNQNARTRLSTVCHEKLFEAQKNFAKRKTRIPPADFCADALWFGSFSESGLPAFFEGGRDHVGSIYFDGGRIRLMHSSGPTVETLLMNRTLNADVGRKVLDKKDDVLELAKRVADAKKRESGGERLYEYTYGMHHPSRGYPKKIILNNNEIAQLYYTIKRLDQIRESLRYPESLVNSAGNRLLIQFLRVNSRLRRELGYEGLL